MNFAFLVSGLAHRLVLFRRFETLRDAPNLAHCLAPGAVQLQYLRSMHEAGAGEGHELGLGRAPVGESLRPFAGAIEREGLLTADDQPAVNQPGHDRGQFAGRRSHHRLVEDRETLGEAALAHQGAAEHAAGERNEIGLSKTLANR